MAKPFEGHGHEEIARLIGPNHYTTKPEPLEWSDQPGDALRHPFQWLDWWRYRFTYYRRFPAVLSCSDIRRGWSDVMRVPRSDGEGYYLVSRRPEGEKSLRSRFKHAWAVFTGKADVIYWLSQ